MADGEFVTYREAFTSPCPFCRLVMLLTPVRREAEEAERLSVPDPARYSEPVATGGGVVVHFVRCAGCGNMYVCRQGPRASDLEKLRNWELRMKYRAPDPTAFIDDKKMRDIGKSMIAGETKIFGSGAPPKIHLDWQGIPFKDWMKETLAQPNIYIRDKAIRACRERGLVLPWDDVAAEMRESTSA